jgi:hypothetical protein
VPGSARAENFKRVSAAHGKRGSSDFKRIHP